MEILRNIIVFSGKSFVYSGLISFLGLALSWLLYKYVVVRRVSLRDALFEKDNLAAWTEFVGAFLFPIFYLSAKAIEATPAITFKEDLYYGLVFMLVYALIFTVLRLVCGWVVHFVVGSDENGKIDLYKEVYEQKNMAAALFSVSFAVLFVNMLSNIKFINSGEILGQMTVTMTSIEGLKQASIRGLEILVLSLVFYIVYAIFNKKHSIFNEIFVDNNTAAGFVFLGFTVATQIILNSSVNYNPDFLTRDMVILSIIAFFVLLLTVNLSKFVYEKVLKVKISDELYIQNNVGVALGEFAVYVGVALVIAHFLQ